MIYILPINQYNASGGQPAHRNANGRPACGAPMPERYVLYDWLCAWDLCPECEKIRKTGMVQSGLFMEMN